MSIDYHLSVVSLFYIFYQICQEDQYKIANEGTEKIYIDGDAAIAYYSSPGDDGNVRYDLLS